MRHLRSAFVLLPLLLAACGENLPVKPDAQAAPKAAAVQSPAAAVSKERYYTHPGALSPKSNPWGGTCLRLGGVSLIAAAMHSDDTMAVWRIDRDRSVTELAQVGVGYHPDHVAALQGGKVAIAVEGTNKLQIWQLDTEKAPVKLKEFNTPFPTRTVVSADVDGDGKLDLLLAPYAGERVAVLWGKGKDVFSEPLMLQAAPTPWYPTVADWDGDGRLDILWSDWDKGSARVYLNRGKRKFERVMLQEEGKGTPRQMAVGDVDGDGRPDGVLALSTLPFARVLLNRPDGVVVEEIPAPSWGYDAAAVAKDGLVVLGEELRVILARRGANGWERRVLSAGAMPSPLMLDDVDADGHEDLIIFHSGRGGVLIHYGPLWDNAQPLVDAPAR